LKHSFLRGKPSDKLKFSYTRTHAHARKESDTSVTAIEIIAVENLPLVMKGDNLAKLICDAAKKQNSPIQEKDVIVITHVAVSKAEGNVVNLDEVSPSERAKEIALKVGKEPALVEVILRETKEIVRMKPNSLITENKNGIVCANAGVDRSNVKGERNVVLLPKNPDASAQKIRQKIKRLTGCDVAVIISDTHGRPLRMGEINVAIGVAGIKPIRDRRGEKDLFGYVLRIKQTAVADELASAAELVIGQANEGIPAAIIRAYNYQTAENATAKELTRPKEADLFR
jgi:coenzyme F420-0:L-glutamate ligase/coenzyme F420-1:gamma-L-glutamate ligase